MATISITSTDVGIPSGVTTIDGGLNNIVTLLFGLIGALSIVALIFGAVQLTYSQGDPGRIQMAKNTIQYAVIGILVAASAYLIVWFFAHNVGSGGDFSASDQAQVGQQAQQNNP